MPPDSFPHRTIQWAKRTAGANKPLTQSSHYAVSQEGDLHFAFVDKTDSGQYVCTVTNIFIMKHVVRTLSLSVFPGNYLAKFQMRKTNADGFLIENKGPMVRR